MPSTPPDPGAPVVAYTGIGLGLLSLVAGLHPWFVHRALGASWLTASLAYLFVGLALLAGSFLYLGKSLKRPRLLRVGILLGVFACAVLLMLLGMGFLSSLGWSK
jgi:hypothetical protein